jgi:hypothetical protein
MHLLCQTFFTGEKIHFIVPVHSFGVCVSLVTTQARKGRTVHMSTECPSADVVLVHSECATDPQSR